MIKIFERAFNKYNDKGWFKWLPDVICLKVLYHMYFGKKLNLKNPKTFNEKLQWLKLHDRKPLYTKMVDKYSVKEYVARAIGDEYIIPTLGVWDKFDDIDFDALPTQFVLKCTHDSGGLVVVRDKTTFDKFSAKKKIDRCLKRNFYYTGREWPYKGVKPRVIAEKYIEDLSGDDLPDYKIHNFNGIPKVILVCRDRFNKAGLTEDFYSDKWEHLALKRPNIPNAITQMEQPKELNEMLRLSRELSKGCPFMRTDFYSINGKIYFGEITFYPASGFSSFEPEAFDVIWGEWINLNLNL